MPVPQPWQAAGPDLSQAVGTGWYRRSVSLPDGWFAGGEPPALILGFDAADYLAEAWLNGIRLGEHAGGYLPFEFEISRVARPGANDLIVRAGDPPELFSQVPHGKQSWYGPLSGLWQSVWIERRAPVYLGSLRLQSDLTSGTVQGDLTLAGAPPDGLRLEILVRDPQGEPAARASQDVPQSGTPVSLSLKVSQPQPWSPDLPALYTLEASLSRGAEPLDALSRAFGFRTISTRDGRLFLNGEPLYLRGALDQDYYPGTIATPPSLEFLEDQFRKAKDLGLNLLRCHIKAPDPRYYDVADRLGMLVWTDLPSWSVFSPLSAQRGWETLAGMLARDGHHPSLIAWSIINESWGIDLNNPGQRAWLKETYLRMKALDPTRLVVDNSACHPNFHIQSDLDDFHFYRAVPGQTRQWQQFVEEFASRPEWTYSPHGDAARSGQEPLVVSEFGNWGLPDPEALKDEQGRDPWWFETGLEWGSGIVYPHGVAGRFQALGLDKVFGTLQDFVAATQRQQFNALKFQIETLRLHPQIQGYVITELTDVHWECNGLLDLQRHPKAFHQVLGMINAGTLLIPRWERLAYWSGERVSLPVFAARASGAPVEGARLHWSLEDSALDGWLSVPTIEPGQVVPAGALEFDAPPVDAARLRRLNLELRDPQGSCLARNFLDLALYPPRQPVDQAPLYTPDPLLAEKLASLGYRLQTHPGIDTLSISAGPLPELLENVINGGRLLLLADRSPQPRKLLPGLKLESRQDSAWAGEWVSAFAWLQRTGPFGRLPGGPLLDLTFERAMPEAVLTGLHPWETRYNPAGMVVGWVHKPAALIAGYSYGRGRAVVNTFRLPDEDLGRDPTATTVFDGLVEWSIIRSKYA